MVKELGRKIKEKLRILTKDRKYKEKREMKNTITEIKNTLEVINSRSYDTGDRSMNWKTE